MEGRWLSSKRHALTPDIRDFIRVHGKVVKPRLAKTHPDPPNPSQHSMRQMTITNRRKSRGRSVAFAYTTGVRKKVHVVGEHLEKAVAPAYAMNAHSDTREHGPITSPAIQVEESSSDEDVVPCCSKQHVESRGAIGLKSNRRPKEDQGQPAIELIDNTDSSCHTSDTFSTEGTSDVGSEDPSLIDTVALLKELSDCY